jgi:hypothetical protein
MTELATLSVVPAQEKKINREELPHAVERTVAEQTQGATILGLSRRIESGKTIYEAELRVNGQGKGISMDEKVTSSRWRRKSPWIHCPRL